MLQRSWTVEHDEAEDVPGAVYVGKASFRMVRVAAETPEEGGEPLQPLQALDDGMDSLRRPTLLPERVQTERIVLVPGSIRVERTAPLPGTHRRPLSLLFGMAFGVGVLCTLVGQVVLHSRERFAQQTPAVAGIVATSARSASTARPELTAIVPLDRAVPAPAVVSAPAGLDVVLDPVAVKAAAAGPPDGAPAIAVAGEVGATREPVAVGSAVGDGAALGNAGNVGTVGNDRKLRARTSRRAAKASAAAPRPRGHASPAWVDPFATDGGGSREISADEPAPARAVAKAEGKTEGKTEGTSETASKVTFEVGGGERKTKAHTWVDPFAE